MASTGWPTDADLAAKLGLGAADDTANVASANAAARSDAVRSATFDDAEGCRDASEWEAVLGLGVWWYQDRNRPPDLGSLGPFSTTAPGRNRWVQILQSGRDALPIA